MKNGKIVVSVGEQLTVSAVTEQGAEAILAISEYHKLEEETSAESISFGDGCLLDMIYQYGLTPCLVVGLFGVDPETCEVEASGDRTYRLVVALAKEQLKYDEPVIDTFIAASADAKSYALC